MGEEIIKKEDYNNVIVIDLAVIPQGWDVEKMIHVMKTTGFCIIDSHKGGIEPYMLNSKRKLQYKIIQHTEYNKQK